MEEEMKVVLDEINNMDIDQLEEAQSAIDELIKEIDNLIGDKIDEYV